ncbi:50S ribosomal protein L4 [Desulfothermus okinawensis JCM 13304]
MTVVNIYDQEKKVVGEIELPDTIFNVEVKPGILNFVVKAHLAAKRVGTASVKTRSTIRGGGKKPWRQKGTGRARVGTIRSPLWVGGAVAHGPKPRDYSFKVNKKVKRLAMKMALSSKLQGQKLIIVDKLEVDEPKTKMFVKIKKALEVKKALIVLPKQDNNIFLSARNLPDTKLLLDKDINVYDLLKYDTLVVTAEAVENIKKRLA